MDGNDGNKARSVILEKISQSQDATLGKGKYFHSRSFLHNLDYSDVMDIVLYYISLQDDLDEIAKISRHDFSDILKKVTREWVDKVEKQWGKVKTPRFYGSKETYDHPRIWEISGAWTPGPGPMGGTMSRAEYYEVLHPGFSQHKYLLLFFRYPEGLSKELCGNWPAYKKHRIEDMTFPKWRRKIHQKRLMTVLDLAESVCQELRKREAVRRIKKIKNR